MDSEYLGGVSVDIDSKNKNSAKIGSPFRNLSIYLYILSQPRKEDIRTGAQRHRAKKKKE